MKDCKARKKRRCKCLLLKRKKVAPVRKICAPKRKTNRKKLKVIRRIYVRKKAVRGLQGIRGPSGIQGPPGPTGPIPSITLTAKRYFFLASSDIELPADIPANQFTNDDGEAIAEFMDFDQNSYANLYINGIMQVGGSYNVSPSALTIQHDHDTIFAGTPLILETVRLLVQIIP